jgi:hypothetical protein
MAAANPDWAAIILPSLIGAISGSFGGNIVTHWLKKREEKGKLRKELTERYVLQLQYSIQTFYNRLYNMKKRGGDKYMNYITGNNEYYKISTLCSLGSILAYHRILLSEGIYSQMEYVYPKFGNLLLTKFDEFGYKLDNMEIKNPDSKSIKFFRYDRMTLGDAVTETINGTSRLLPYLKFKDMYKNDEKINSTLERATEFIENLPFSPELETLMDDLEYLLKELKQKTQIDTERFVRGADKKDRKEKSRE